MFETGRSISSRGGYLEVGRWFDRRGSWSGDRKDRMIDL